MRGIIVTVLVTAAILVVPATALAKGPSEAAISGPGLAAPLRVDARRGLVEQDSDEGAHLGEPGQFGALMEHAGFSEGAWGPQTGVPAMGQPAGELGARYTVSWTVPGPTGADALVRQDLYPYAEGGPLTHVAPGQPFFDGQHTAGGWFAGGPELSALLFDLGLREPAPPPTTAPRPAALVAASAVLAAAGCAAVWALARARRRPAAQPG